MWRSSARSDGAELETTVRTRVRIAPPSRRFFMMFSLRSNSTDRLLASNSSCRGKWHIKRSFMQRLQHKMPIYNKNVNSGLHFMLLY